jgi:hypothetical protein
MLYGTSFVRRASELPGLLRDNPGLKRYLRTHVNGDILNHTPDVSGDEFVIDFGDLDKNQISGCEFIIKELAISVASERANQTRQVHEHRPWLHWDKRLRFYTDARKKPRIIAWTIVSKYLVFQFVDPENLYTHGIKLLLDARFSVFATLQSSIHYEWALATASKLGGTLRYSTSDCLDTFPFPRIEQQAAALDVAGQAYEQCRTLLARRIQAGVHEVYERFHRETDADGDIIELRELHRQLDAVVASAYGWTDLAANQGAALRHDFHGTKQGVRWTLHPDVRRDVLDRLLALNHQRHAEEAAEGLHGKKGSAAKRRKQSTAKPDTAPELGLE